MKTDPCPYLVKDSPDVIKKKTKVLDILNTDKKYTKKMKVESCPQEIWIRIRFLKKTDPHHSSEISCLLIDFMMYLSFFKKSNQSPNLKLIERN